MEKALSTLDNASLKGSNVRVEKETEEKSFGRLADPEGVAAKRREKGHGRGGRQSGGDAPSSSAQGGGEGAEGGEGSSSSSSSSSSAAAAADAADTEARDGGERGGEEKFQPEGGEGE